MCLKGPATVLGLLNIHVVFVYVCVHEHGCVCLSEECVHVCVVCERVCAHMCACVRENVCVCACHCVCMWA